MLQSLHIENMAIISSLDVDFSNGLCAITGETGAGKSVMIDAILFLLGGKPPRDILRRGAERGMVSAVFSDVGAACASYLTEMGFCGQDLTDDTELLLQRSLDQNGKTAARLNGRMIPQTILRELSRYLVSVHGQADNQLLLQQAVQKQMLDGVADFGEALARYRGCYQKRAELEHRLSETARDAAETARLADMLRFQITEIDEAHLKPREEEELLAQRTKLQYAEKIAKQTAFAYHVLYGSEKASAFLIFERAASALAGISGVIPEAESLAERLTAMRYEIEDIANTARDYGEEVEGDPTEVLNRVEARLDLISKLERKYGKDISEILAFRAKAAERLCLIDHSDEESARLTAEIKALEAQMQTLAAQCHAARVAAAKELNGRIAAELAFLDMPSVRFEIAVTQKESFLPDGNDDVCFMIATNKGEAMMPLSRVASGGELARVTLALRSVLNDRDGVGTAVFDEVDTGISGKTARKIGMKLSEIGKKTQVLCVTHSAQIASLATAHYKIAKAEQEERTVSTVSLLDDEGRVAEVARILGGISVTDTQRRAAAEMIGEGEAYR
ncbi:MAG: DNA repair protein RecN [Clostridia bacterium]|nr:DNA repair protein RecN [Clostridia bacterium]